MQDHVQRALMHGVEASELTFEYENVNQGKTSK